MNTQALTDFLDLVKNPEKYQKYLDEIVAEQGRLTAVIETVGKASELDRLRKKVEKEYNKQQQDYEDSVAKNAKTLEDALKNLQTQVAAAKEQQEHAKLLVQDATEKAQRAQEQLQSFASREKELRRAEEGMLVKQQQLDATMVEYSEKLAKLRAVMN